MRQVVGHSSAIQRSSRLQISKLVMPVFHRGLGACSFVVPHHRTMFDRRMFSLLPVSCMFACAAELRPYSQAQHSNGRKRLVARTTSVQKPAAIGLRAVNHSLDMNLKHATLPAH